MSWSDFIWKSYKLMSYKSISPIEIYPFSRAIGIIIFLEVILCQPLLKMCIRSIYYMKCSWKSISRVTPEHGPNWTFIGWFLNTASSRKNCRLPRNHLCSNVVFFFLKMYLCMQVTEIGIWKWKQFYTFDHCTTYYQIRGGQSHVQFTLC